MVDPDKLNAFDASLANLKASTDKAAESNAAGVAAAADAAQKAGTANSDFADLQNKLDVANTAGAAIGLKVNAPAV
jgi:hypothetical protein